MKSWLKGGLIFVGVYVVLFLIASIFLGKWSNDASLYYPYSMLDIILEIPGEVILSPSNFVSECIYQSVPGEDYSWCPSRSTITFLLSLSSLIFYFLIGSIVGLVIQKIEFKTRKKSRR